MRIVPAAVVSVANPASPVHQEERRDYFDGVALEIDDDHLAIAAHISRVIRRCQNVLDLLEQGGLAVPLVSLEASMNVRGQNEIEVDKLAAAGGGALGT